MADSGGARLWAGNDQQLGHDRLLPTVPRRTGLDSRAELFQSWFPRPHVSIRPDWPLALSALAGRAKPVGHLGHSLLDWPQSKPGHSGRHPRHLVQEEQTNGRLTGAHFFGASFVYWHSLGFVLWVHQQTRGGARHHDGSLGERVLSRGRHVGHPGSTLQPAEYGFRTALPYILLSWRAKHWIF